MRIESKASALRKVPEGKQARVSKFCAGKYKWAGKASEYEGHVVLDLPDVLAVYVERRTDRDGPYAQLMAVQAE